MLQFVNGKKENNVELQKTLNAADRSLCLISAESFEGFIHKYNERSSVRVTFDYEGEHFRNVTGTPGYPLTDLKWRAYILQNKEIPIEYDNVFICIGLARKEPAKNINKEFPMVISIITDPYLPLLPSYPN